MPAAEFRTRLGLTPVGDEVDLKYLRGSETRSLRARIGEPQQVGGGEGQSIPQLPGMQVVSL